MSKPSKPDFIAGSASVSDLPPLPPPPAPRAEPPKGAPVKAKPRRLPVDAMAIATGHIVVVTLVASGGRKVRRGDAAHAAASTLHGWRDHVAATGEQLSLTEAEYLAALDAAKGPPPGKQSLVPHAPALSPHSKLFPPKRAE